MRVVVDPTSGRRTIGTVRRLNRSRHVRPSAAGRAVDAAMWPQRCQECLLSVRRLDDFEDRVVARRHGPEANWSLLTVAPSHGGSLLGKATALKPCLARLAIASRGEAARRRAP